MRPVLQLLAAVVLAVALPAGLCRHFNDAGEFKPAERGCDVAQELARLEAENPDWVLIGNSMLFTRIDDRRLSAVSGHKVSELSRGGSQSAIWFLFFKNVLLKSKVRPRVVTFFFRDTDLTWPDFRLDRGMGQVIADLKGPAQPEWNQVLGHGGNNATRLDEEGSESPNGTTLAGPGSVNMFLHRLFPTSELRPIAREQMQQRAFRMTRIGTHANSRMRRAELNERFSLVHLRTDLGSDAGPGGGGAGGIVTTEGEFADPGAYEDGPAKFDPSPGSSFLPHIIQLAKAQGIQLHFHRIKRRPLLNNKRPDPTGLHVYMKDLESYLASQGCWFTDESADLRLTLDMYVDGDHISSDDSVQQKYLANFWERVRPVISSVALNQPPAPVP